MLVIVDSDAVWRHHLSVLGLKRSLYEREPYFRESLHDFTGAFGEAWIPTLDRLALAVLKPDAFVGRRAGAALDFIIGRGLTPVATREVHYTYHAIRELWRYQWNAATFQKMLLSEWIHDGLPAVLIVFRDDSEPRRLPATVRLKALKGHAEADARSEDSLRTVVRSPNRMMTIVHTADEPADLIRELGVFFDRKARRTLIAELGHGIDGDITDTLRPAVARLEAAAPHADLDPAAALQRLLALQPPGDRAAFRAHAAGLATTDIREWERFIHAGRQAGGDKWDLISVCSEAIEHQDAGYEPLISFGEPEIQAWLDDSSPPG